MNDEAAGQKAIDELNGAEYDGRTISVSVNASMEEAHALGEICKNFPNCHVNLIPVNGNEHIELYKPSITNMNTFKDIVASYGVSVTVRKEMGDAIQAACGQLKAAHGRKKENHE